MSSTGSKLAIVLFILGASASLSAVTAPNQDISLHPAAAGIDIPMGPFVLLDEGHILTVDEHNARISGNGGASWDSYSIFKDKNKFAIRPERALVRTEDNTIILAFMNDVERHWTWDRALGDAPGARLPTYVVRSLDGGKNWEEPQMLHAEWTGAIRNMIQTSGGDVVFTSMMLLHDPGRHATVTYLSSDEGQTWRRSNIIDLGGAGHHDGAIESTIEELSDGRLYMLLRTNWDRFWEAYSDDGGRYWRIIRPSEIDAGSAPGLLARLESGKLVLIWNRLLPEGVEEFPRVGGNRVWSEEPAINHRWEMSIAFSEDDGRSWSEPVVFARADETMGRRDISYPYLFEPRAGELWITSMRGELRARLFEKDFVGAE